MTRISTRNVKGRSERPEPLGRPIGVPSRGLDSPLIRERLTAYRSLYDGDAYPQLSPADARALRREADFRARELADLPDDGEVW